MKRDIEQTIERLAADLEPVRVAADPRRVALFWWLGSCAFVIAIALLVGPIRSNAFEQLASSPRFLMEMLIGLAASVVLSIYAFADAVPGAGRPRTLYAGLTLAAIWVAAFLVGLEHPALEPSMAGKREFCFEQTLLFTLPPAFAAILWSRRYYVLGPVKVAALLTLASAMLPAILMQVVCMYEPAHILSHHVLPILIIVPGVSAAAWLVAYLREH